MYLQFYISLCLEGFWSTWKLVLDNVLVSGRFFSSISENTCVSEAIAKAFPDI